MKQSQLCPNKWKYFASCNHIMITMRIPYLWVDGGWKHRERQMFWRAKMTPQINEQIKNHLSNMSVKLHSFINSTNSKTKSISTSRSCPLSTDGSNQIDDQNYTSNKPPPQYKSHKCQPMAKSMRTIKLINMNRRIKNPNRINGVG